MSSVNNKNIRPGSTAIALALGSVMATGLLTGCANWSEDHIIVGSVPDDYRNRHPIVVAENEVTEDIPVSANMKALSFRDENVVHKFASRFRRAKARHMQLMLPSQSPNEVAARKIASIITSKLISKGIMPGQISRTSYHAAGHSSVAPIRLSFVALSAEVGECGRWNENIAGMETNRNYQNFGCASQNNLAKMIANPADLVGPRGESSIDAERRNNVITNWRENGSENLGSQF